MSVTASIQWLAGCLRVHPEGGDWRGHAPYNNAMTVMHVDGDQVELLGLCKPLTRPEARAILRAVKDAGYKRVRQDRGGRIVHTEAS